VLSAATSTPGLLAEIGRRPRDRDGPRIVVLSRLSDRPGLTRALLTLIGESGANLIESSHVREGLDLHVRETAVELVLETRGRDHAETVLARSAPAATRRASCTSARASP
jgi:threonine dehydratase